MAPCSSQCRRDSTAPRPSEDHNAIPDYLFLCRCEFIGSVPRRVLGDAAPDINTFIWTCPWSECVHRLNFVELVEATAVTIIETTQQDVEHLDRMFVVACAAHALERIAHCHYFQHYIEIGMRFLRTGETVRSSWPFMASKLTSSSQHRIYWATPEIAIERRRAIGLPVLVPGADRRGHSD